MRYLFNLECPRCGKQSQTSSSDPKPPRVHCGDCLMNDVEIVPMLVNIGEIEGTLVGTCHFKSLDAACRYYRRQGIGIARDVWAKVDAGEIKIGPPDLPAGAVLVLIDGGTRYGILET